MQPISMIFKLGLLACACGAALLSIPATAADKPAEQPSVYLGYLESITLLPQESLSCAPTPNRNWTRLLNNEPGTRTGDMCMGCGYVRAVVRVDRQLLGPVRRMREYRYSTGEFCENVRFPLGRQRVLVIAVGNEVAVDLVEGQQNNELYYFPIHTRHVGNFDTWTLLEPLAEDHQAEVNKERMRFSWIPAKEYPFVREIEGELWLVQAIKVEKLERALRDRK